MTELKTASDYLDEVMGRMRDPGALNLNPKPLFIGGYQLFETFRVRKFLKKHDVPVPQEARFRLTSLKGREPEVAISGPGTVYISGDFDNGLVILDGTINQYTFCEPEFIFRIDNVPWDDTTRALMWSITEDCPVSGAVERLGRIGAIGSLIIPEDSELTVSQLIFKQFVPGLGTVYPSNADGRYSRGDGAEESYPGEWLGLKGVKDLNFTRK